MPEPVEAALHDVALLVPVAVELRWSPAGRPPGAPVRPLVALLRNRVGDAAAAQRPAGGGMGVGLVRDQVIGARARPPGADAGHPDGIQQGQQLRVVPGLTGRAEHRQRQPTPIHGQMDLAGQSASGAAEGLTVDREGLDRCTAAPFFRAPAACWCARTLEESTLIVHSTAPTASSLTTTCSRDRKSTRLNSSHANISYAVFHGP